MKAAAESRNAAVARGSPASKPSRASAIAVTHSWPRSCEARRAATWRSISPDRASASLTNSTSSSLKWWKLSAKPRANSTAWSKKPRSGSPPSASLSRPSSRESRY